MIKWEEPECINPIECIEEGGCNPCRMMHRIYELEQEVDNLKDIITGAGGTAPVDVTRRYRDDDIEFCDE